MWNKLSAIWSQSFPPDASFTEKDVGPGTQQGRVFIVTGGSSGIGLDLVKLLYPTGATIYIAGRSLQRIESAIDAVTTVSTSLEAPETPATLKALVLDLSDLTTVKPAAAIVATQESRLDIIWHNAGAGHRPGSITKQGIEAHIGSSCVAPLLLTQELLPLLQNAAKSAPRGEVRIVWTGSVMIEAFSPMAGVDFTRIETPTTMQGVEYAASKAGNWFLAVEGASRWGRDGIISVCENPGNLDTSIWNTENWLWVAFLRTFILHDSKLGARSLLFAGFSPEVNEARNGAYIWPWGRIMLPARPDVVQAVADGKPVLFWQWCEDKWKRFV
ncbi:Short-chain dehydrogenase/reductase [Paramyrothecium foliicola]|nr:Short-chain dehydrogenase/reductase [Paramyrothecium foliicola]